MENAHVRLDRINKSYGQGTVVDDLSLEIVAGEFLTLLGPSGCGKTTTLRMIAGLESPTSGDIEIDGKLVVSTARGIDLPPEERQIGMVFQSYAIWPHMTVAENLGFPLRLRRRPKPEIRDRVTRALALVGLPEFEDRPASRLSGGQQQRVALARALIYEPRLLLLDEPLSNLDAKLREQMQLELRRLQDRLNLTVVYVTHDQTEALSMSDRIVVLNKGRIEQIGRPRDLYERPATLFVRDFLGKSVILRGRVSALDAKEIAITLSDCDATLFAPRPADKTITSGMDIEISIRPEAIRAVPPGEMERRNILTGTIETILYQGERSECDVRIGETTLTIFLPSQAVPRRGAIVELHVAHDAVTIWDGNEH